MTLKCFITGCERRHHARGLCGVHYREARLKGDFGSTAATLPGLASRVTELRRVLALVQTRARQAQILLHSPHVSTHYGITVEEIVAELIEITETAIYDDRDLEAD